MQSLKVLARPGVIVPLPRHAGEQARYVGRDIDRDAFKATVLRHDGMTFHADPVEDDVDKLYPIAAEPAVFSFRDYALFKEIERAVRHGDLLPADKATADLCGVPMPAPANRPAFPTE